MCRLTRHFHLYLRQVYTRSQFVESFLSVLTVGYLLRLLLNQLLERLIFLSFLRFIPFIFFILKLTTKPKRFSPVYKWLCWSVLGDVFNVEETTEVKSWKSSDLRYCFVKQLISYQTWLCHCHLCPFYNTIVYCLFVAGFVLLKKTSCSSMSK